MTITTTNLVVSTTGDGTDAAISVTFAFFGTGTSAELTVHSRVIATGVETLLTNATHYTVTGGSGSTGTVTVINGVTNYPSTVEWYIRRATTKTQGTDLASGGSMPSDSIEKVTDRLTLIQQEISGTLGVAAGYRLARGVVSPTTASHTVATGLTTVVAVTATLVAAPTLTHAWTVATIGDQAGTPVAGSVLIKTYKPTGAGDVTPIAATTPWGDVNWIAVGT